MNERYTPKGLLRSFWPVAFPGLIPLFVLNYLQSDGKAEIPQWVDPVRYAVLAAVAALLLVIDIFAFLQGKNRGVSVFTWPGGSICLAAACLFTDPNPWLTLALIGIFILLKGIFALISKQRTGDFWGYDRLLKWSLGIDIYWFLHVILGMLKV